MNSVVFNMLGYAILQVIEVNTFNLIQKGVSKTQNNRIAEQRINKFRFYAFTITVNHSSLIFIEFSSQTLYPCVIMLANLLIACIK